jgi:UDP-GlcNAc:undecaprenyl-phosphate GlcNAc-1-phosphate transferase
MIEPFVALLIAAIGTLLLTPPVIRLAERCGAMDQPGGRKVHDCPTPRLGGVAIGATFVLVGLAAFGLVPSLRASFDQNLRFWVSLALGTALVFLLGFYDDIWHAGVGVKFAVQFLAAGIVMAYGGVRIGQLGIPFDGVVNLGWLWVPLTALWIVGVTNAFNLIDGLDGLAGGVAFISSMTLFAVALLESERYRIVLVTAVLAGALLGFLRYNRHPARIFLGDCGSMMIGFLLAVLSVVGSVKRPTALALLIPILIVGVPVFDTLYAMAKRLLRKLLVEKDYSRAALRAMFKADKAHIHHVLLDMGYTYRKTVLLLYALSAVLGLFAFAAVLIDNDRVSFGLMLVGICGFIVVRQFGGIRLFHNGRDSSGPKP